MKTNINFCNYLGFYYLKQLQLRFRDLIWDFLPPQWVGLLVVIIPTHKFSCYKNNLGFETDESNKTYKKYGFYNKSDTKITILTELFFVNTCVCLSKIWMICIICIILL